MKVVSYIIIITGSSAPVPAAGAYCEVGVD